MKRTFFIISLICAVLMFTSYPKVDRGFDTLQAQETVVKGKTDVAEKHHRIEFLDKDTRGNNVLTARRTVQSLSLASTVRNVSEIVRVIQDVRIKGADRLQKISEYVSRLQTINYSALLTCKGYHVYALREIII